MELDRRQMEKLRKLNEDLDDASIAHNHNHIKNKEASEKLLERLEKFHGKRNADT
jgi:hypothetical protein